MYSRTKSERETVITFNEGSPWADVFTASAPVMRRLNRLSNEFPEAYKKTGVEMTGDKITASTYNILSKYVKFRKPVTAIKKTAGCDNLSPPQMIE